MSTMQLACNKNSSYFNMKLEGLKCVCSALSKKALSCESILSCRYFIVLRKLFKPEKLSRLKKFISQTTRCPGSLQSPQPDKNNYSN